MDKELNIAGKNVFYRVSGKGQPVMLLHGFGETGRIWNQLETHLLSSFQLIIPDLPGSGQSELQDNMSMEGLAEIIEIIIKAEGIDQFVLIGHSMGGYITLAYAEKYSPRLKAFGLFHSSAFADNEEKKTTRRKGIDFIQANGAFPFLKNTSPNLFSPATKAEMPELIDGFIDGLSNFSATALVLYYESMMARPDRTVVLEKSGVPVLFILGEYDNAIPLEDGLKQCHLPEKSYIHILTRSGHMGMLEEPELANQLIERFLTEN